MGSFDLSEVLFNVDNGFLEGLIRGFKNGILAREDYRHLTQCDTLEGLYAFFFNATVLKHLQLYIALHEHSTMMNYSDLF